MSSGAAHLSYQLHSDSAHSQIWGDGTGGTSVVNGSYFIVLGGTSNFTVDGVIPALQVASPGAYTDSITVTVTY
jgi:spore coat protein U-like protein